MKTILDLLHIEKGVTAVIGSGGKTSLLAYCAELLKTKYKVILTTSTHIFPFPGMQTVTEEAALIAALQEDGVVCVGSRSPEGKLTAPDIPFSRLAELADFVLVEADGSKRLPLKAHLPHEPVIPPESNQTICVVGLSAVGKPIEETAHRPELFAALCESRPEDLATAERIATVLNKEGLYDRVLLNQLDSAPDPACAEALAKMLDCPVVAGSLKEGRFLCL
ncbi:MAG: putative selenium-dependent hydroxylase accessory protein YqeC [Clostridia bacterium]|nr:putative selenium-dependent hydroxylase accessory protein YqeC [Clostridia bacterium]